MKKELNRYMAQNGLELHKVIDSGGVFTRSTYDYKTAYSIKEMQKLLKDGYHPYHEQLGTYLFNVILTEK